MIRSLWMKHLPLMSISYFNCSILLRTAYRMSSPPTTARTTPATTTHTSCSIIPSSTTALSPRHSASGSSKSSRKAFASSISGIVWTPPPIPSIRPSVTCTKSFFSRKICKKKRLGSLRNTGPIFRNPTGKD